MNVADSGGSEAPYYRQNVEFGVSRKRKAPFLPDDEGGKCQTVVRKKSHGNEKIRSRHSDGRSLLCQQRRFHHSYRLAAEDNTVAVQS